MNSSSSTSLSGSSPSSHLALGTPKSRRPSGWERCPCPHGGASAKVKGTNLTEQQVGIHHLHDDVSINFQLNRWVAWTGWAALPDIRSIAGQLTDFATSRRLFLQLAETALAQAIYAAPLFTSGWPSSSSAAMILRRLRCSNDVPRV